MVFGSDNDGQSYANQTSIIRKVKSIEFVAFQLQHFQSGNDKTLNITRRIQNILAITHIETRSKIETLGEKKKKIPNAYAVIGLYSFRTILSPSAYHAISSPL